jgi:hypothetical protein
VGCYRLYRAENGSTVPPMFIFGSPLVAVKPDQHLVHATSLAPIALRFYTIFHVVAT